MPFVNRASAELFLTKVLASFDDDVLNNAVLLIRDIYASTEEKGPFTTRVAEVAFLMKILNPLCDRRFNSAITIISGWFAPELWKEVYFGLETPDVETSNAVETPAVVNTTVTPTTTVEKRYVPPPRVRDAETHWPYARCKNIVKVIYHHKRIYGNIPTSHHALLEYIAGIRKVSIDELKKTNPRDYFKDQPYIPWIRRALSRSWRTPDYVYFDRVDNV